MFHTSWRCIYSLWKVRSCTEHLGISIVRAHSHTKAYLLGCIPKGCTRIIFKVINNLQKSSSFQIQFVANDQQTRSSFSTKSLWCSRFKMIALKFLCNFLHSNKSSCSCEQHHWNLSKYYRTYIYRNNKLAYLWYIQGLSYTKINKPRLNKPNGIKMSLELRGEFGPSMSSFYVMNWKLLPASLLGNDIYEIVFLYKNYFYHLP